MSHKFKVSTGQSPGSCGNEGKKNSVNGFPCLDCLARPLGLKVTPFGLYCLPLRLSCDRSADLEGRVNAKSIVVFQLNCFNDGESLLPQLEIQVSTVCTFHVHVYLGNVWSDVRQTGPLPLDRTDRQSCRI